MLWCLLATIKSSAPEGRCDGQRKCDQGRVAAGAFCFARCCFLDSFLVAFGFLFASRDCNIDLVVTGSRIARFQCAQRMRKNPFKGESGRTLCKDYE